MDRAHRLGQTKQVTVYRLICKGTIEERILQRAREKSEIQRMVISGGNFKPDTLKPKEVVSLLLDDEEIETKYRQKIDSANQPGISNESVVSQNIIKEQNVSAKIYGKKKRPPPNKVTTSSSTVTSISPTYPEELSTPTKRIKLESVPPIDDDSIDVGGTSESTSSTSPLANHETNEALVPGATTIQTGDYSETDTCDSPKYSAQHDQESPTLFDDFGGLGPIRRRHHPRGTKRGRPRGSTRRGTTISGTLIKNTSQSNIDTLITSTSTVTSIPISSNINEVATDVATVCDRPTSPITITGEGVFTPTAIPIPMKRGPGRPRLKTGGPINQGIRGTSRTRKAIGPLVVPLGNSPASTPINCSPAMSPAYMERSSTSSTSSSIMYYQPTDD